MIFLVNPAQITCIVLVLNHNISNCYIQPFFMNVLNVYEQMLIFCRFQIFCIHSTKYCIYPNSLIFVLIKKHLLGQSEIFLKRSYNIHFSHVLCILNSFYDCFLWLFTKISYIQFKFLIINHIII